MIASALLCLVVGIADGDTLTARCGEADASQQISIRLSEIDAPEKGQPFGPQARQSLAALCLQKTAEVRPISKDRYGRTVARVICAGRDANLEQVRAGMAWAFTKYLTDPAIQHAENDARVAGVGLWADARAMPPWEWRRGLAIANRKPE